MKKLFIILLFASSISKAQENNIGFYGNSIVNDVGATAGNGFVSVCMRTLGATHFTGCKWAQNGYQTGQMLANYSTQIDASCFNVAGYTRNIFVPYEYVNSLVTGGESAPQVYSKMKALCLAEKAQGRYVVLPTMIDAPSQTGIAASRTQLNDSLVANWRQFADTIARVDTIVGMTYIDGLHPDDAGHYKMGVNIANAIYSFVFPSVAVLPSAILRVGRKAIIQ